MQHSFRSAFSSVFFFFFLRDTLLLDPFSFFILASQSGVNLVSGLQANLDQNVLMHINYIACWGMVFCT